MTAGSYDPNQYPQGDPQFSGTPQFDNQGVGPQPGSLGLRFGARIIDGIIVGIVTLILALIIGSNQIVLGLIAGLLGYAYFVAFDVTQGWTPGKKVLGLSVHGPGGEKPTLQQAAIRESFNVLGIIPFIGGLLSLVAVIVIAVTINSSPSKQGKHDEFAGGTQVLKG